MRKLREERGGLLLGVGWSRKASWRRPHVCHPEKCKRKERERRKGKGRTAFRKGKDSSAGRRGRAA